MLTLIIYLLGVVDAFKGAVTGIIITVVVAASIAYPLLCMDWHGSYGENKEKDNERRKKVFKSIKPVAIGMSLCLFFLIFTPTSKTLAAMYLIPKITSNKDMQEIPGKTLKILNSKLEQYITDIISKQGD